MYGGMECEMRRVGCGVLIDSIDAELADSIVLDGRQGRNR